MTSGGWPGERWGLVGVEVARFVEAEAELLGAVGVGAEDDPADVLVGDEQEGGRSGSSSSSTTSRLTQVAVAAGTRRTTYSVPSAVRRRTWGLAAGVPAV